MKNARSNCSLEIINVSAAADDQLISDRELARRWSCSPKTLRNHRSMKIGCPYIRLSCTVRYRLSDVLAYKADQLRRTQNAPGAGR